MVLHGRPRRLSGRAARQGRPFAGGALRGPREGRKRERRLGLVLGAGCRDAGRRKLRQPDPDAAGRNSRERHALGSDRRRARVLRVSEPRAARPEARARGRLDGRRLRAFGAHAKPAVRRADQGKALFARIRRVRLGRRQGRLRALAQPASGSGREDRAVRDRQCAGAHQGCGARDAQAHNQRAGAARQARGLHAAGAGALRAVPGRGRLRGRLREAGARPFVSRLSCRCAARS